MYKLEVNWIRASDSDFNLYYHWSEKNTSELKKFCLKLDNKLVLSCDVIWCRVWYNYSHIVKFIYLINLSATEHINCWSFSCTLAIGGSCSVLQWGIQMYIKVVDGWKGIFVVIRKIIPCETTHSFSFHMRTYTCSIFLVVMGLRFGWKVMI